MKDEKITKMVNSQIQYIRRMSLLTDEQLRLLLTQNILEHPHLVDNYIEEEQKKMYSDMMTASKDIKSNPLKISRKIA